MITHPAQLLLSLLFGLFALCILGCATWLLYFANRRRKQVIRVSNLQPVDGGQGARLVSEMIRHPHRTALNTVAALMLLWVFAGKYVVSMFFPGGQPTTALPTPTMSVVRGASGAELAVANYGPADGPVLIFTHGWGADHRDWAFAISKLASTFHIIAWDLPGLGESSPTNGRDYRLSTLAGDLDSVVSSASGRPVILVGHSIGGMLNLEYAKRFPQRLGTDVRAIVQANTTYTNPVETKKGAETSRKLQKPIYEPLLHAIVWISPVVRVAGWFAYQSGLSHMQLAKQSFAGAQTWPQLDEMARYTYRSSPGIVAQGTLGMLAWDATDILPKINVPTLIISGNEDVTTMPSASDRMQHDIPSAARVSVPRAAHLGPVEQYQAYADAIASFAAGKAP